MPQSISQILNEFGMERLDNPPPPHNPHNNNIMDVVPADSINPPTTSTTQVPPLMTVANSSQAASPPPMTTSSSSHSALQPPQPDAQGVVTRTGDVTTSERLLTTMEADLAGISDATSIESSTAQARGTETDLGFQVLAHASDSGPWDGQRASSPQSHMPTQAKNSTLIRRPRSSHALREYQRHLATLMTLAEDAPFVPCATNNFTPQNPFTDRLAAIGNLMRAYRDLSDNEIGLENTTVGQQRGRLQQIVDLQWQVFENGLTGDIEEMDRLMRGADRGNNHDQDATSDSASDHDRSSQRREVEFEDQDQEFTHGSRGRGASLYARGGRGGGDMHGRGRGRGHAAGLEQPSRHLDDRHDRSSGPPSRDFGGPSSSRGGERGRSRERAPWDEVPNLESQRGLDRGFENRGFTAEEIAFINSGPVDPALVNAPVARSTESQDTTFEGQEGSDYGSGEDSDDEESASGDWDSQDDEEFYNAQPVAEGDQDIYEDSSENFFDAEQVVEDDEGLFEQDNRRMRELSVSEEPQEQDVERQEEGGEQEVSVAADTLADQEVGQVVETVEPVIIALVRTENGARSDRQDHGREERSMAWE